MQMPEYTPTTGEILTAVVIYQAISGAATKPPSLADVATPDEAAVFVAEFECWLAKHEEGIRADERAKLDQERIEWENELIDVLSVGDDDDVDQRELIMQHARRLAAQRAKQVDASQIQAIVDHIADMADSLDEHITHDDIYGALGDLNSMVRELKLTDRVDLEALTTALFELSHQPSFEDSTAGTETARATAQSFVNSYWTQTSTRTPDVEWVRDGVCLLSGEGVLESGEHLDPDRHAASVERILTDEADEPNDVLDSVAHRDEQKRTHL